MERPPLLVVLLCLLVIGAALFSLAPEASAAVTRCSDANLTISSCKVSSGILRVSYSAQTLTNVEKLSYVFTPALGEDLFYGATSSQGFPDVTLRSLGSGNHTLTMRPGTEISEVHVSDPLCTGGQYVSARAACELTTTENFLTDTPSCADYPSIEARVRCRLYTLSTASSDIPEECRIFEAAEEQGCIARHKELTPCLSRSTDDDALSCGRGVIGMANFTAEKARCDSLAGTDREACVLTLKAKVDRMALFTFRLLGQKARTLLLKGVDESKIVTFISLVEVRAQAYQSVPTLKEKMNIVSQVNQLWEEFLFSAEPQVLSHVEESRCDDCA